MEELASDAIRTIAISVESFALLGLVVFVNIYFLFQLVKTMCEGARASKFTFASDLPVLADFCLVFDFKAFNVFAHFLFGVELLLVLARLRPFCGLCFFSKFLNKKVWACCTKIIG